MNKFTLNHIIKWFELASEELDKQKNMLTELDAAIGDADHGANISRGYKLAVEAILKNNYKNIGELFKGISLIMMTKVGGASGMLYTAFFMKAAKAAENKEELSISEMVELFDIGITGIMSRGRANLGDKTMMDVWLPILEIMKEREKVAKTLKEFLKDIGKISKRLAEETKLIIAKKGRASYLGERSIGHIDPGAMSTAIILSALERAIT